MEPRSIIKNVVLVSCSKTKLQHPDKARNLYQGRNFKKCLKYAELLNPDFIFILSAKYGLLELDTVIEPYELTLMGKPAEFKRSWTRRVLEEAERVY